MSVRRIQRSQRMLPALIGFVILLAIGLLPVTLPTEDNTSTVADDDAYANPVPGAPPRPIGGIFVGITVAQEFPAAGTEINAVGLVLATYQRVNNGTFQVLMQAQSNGRWETLGSQTVEKATLRDNVLNTVTFDPPLKTTRGQRMRIVLQTDGNAQNAISWWITPTYRRPGFALFRNGDPEPGAAQFQISYARSSGRLVGMIGPVWGRLTIFLDPRWRIVLAASLVILIAGIAISLRGPITYRAPPPDAAERLTEE